MVFSLYCLLPDAAFMVTVCQKAKYKYTVSPIKNNKVPYDM